jgi:hypothetical protein
MSSVSPEDRRAHLKRVLVGSAFGLLTGILCPHLPEPFQVPCRVVLILVHGWVNP